MSSDNTFFSIDNFESYSLVKFLKTPDAIDFNTFEKKISEISQNNIIIDCDLINEIEKECIRSLLIIHLAKKKESRFLKFIHVNSLLFSCFKKEGVDSSFKISKDLKEALLEIGVTPKKSISTDFIESFLKSTINVLKIQTEIDASYGKFDIAKTKDHGICDISGVIGIICNNFNGSVIISFPEKTYLNVISKMLGEDFHEIQSENMDGAAELTNMIFGQAKLVLNEKGFGIKMALPSVILGRPDSFISLNTGPAILVPFSSSAGDFYIRIGLTA